MEQIDIEESMNRSRLLFKIEWVIADDSEIFKDYVVASSLEAAISLYRCQRKSHIIRNTHLIACENGGFFAPISEDLFLEG